MGKRFVLGLVAALSLGCSSHPGRLVVAVDTDYVVPAELSSIRVDVAAIDAAGTRAQYDGGPMTRRFNIDGRIGEPREMGELLPISFVVNGRSADQRVEIVVEGIDPDERVLVTRRAVTGFVEGRTLVLPIFLARSCATVVCPLGQSCGNEGFCVDELQPPDVLDVLPTPPDGSFDPFDAARPDAGRDAGGDAGCPECEPFIDVETSAKSTFTCARTQSRRAFCWGRNVEGQVGIGSSSAAELFPREVVDLGEVEEIATGGNHACARPMTQTPPLCWGRNTYGQLGIGSDAMATVFRPMAAMTARAALALAAGDAHTCAIVSDGVMCWGNNQEEQALPDSNPNAEEPRPVLVPGVLSPDEIATGGYHSCALDGGSVTCWGRNVQGQLGDGATSGHGPVAVSGLIDAVLLAAGHNFSCALREDGDVLWWGQYEIDDVGGMRQSSVPIFINTASDAVQLVAGAHHFCVRHITGTITCWGNNSSGQLGDGTTAENGPSNVVGIDDASDIAAGGNHTCAVRSTDGSIWCWGDNSDGQLGDGTLTGRTVPGPVRWR